MKLMMIQNTCRFVSAFIVSLQSRVSTRYLSYPIVILVNKCYYVRRGRSDDDDGKLASIFCVFLDAL